MSATSLKDGIFPELLDTFKNIAAKTPVASGENSQYLLDNQIQDRAKSPNRKFLEPSVLIDDGDLNIQLSSTTSGSTSGVFCSMNSSNEGSKHDSSSIKICLLLEENSTHTGSFRDSNVFGGDHPCNVAQKHSVPPAFTSNPGYVAEAAENCYEVTIHHTVISPRVNNSSVEDIDTGQKRTLVSVKEGSSAELHNNEQILSSNQTCCHNEGDQENQNTEEGDSSFNEPQLTESETSGVPKGFNSSFSSADSERELQNGKTQEHFDCQRRRQYGLYRNDTTGKQLIQQEAEKDINAKTKTDMPGRMEPCQQSVATPRENTKADYSPICPVLLGNDDELDIEEKEYTEAREFSSYSKYTQGPFSYYPMPMDDILEEGANFQVHHVFWAFPNIAKEYHGDNFTAVVPFANKMREEDHEEYPKQKLTLKEKFQDKLQKLKKFFGRNRTRVELASIDETLLSDEPDQDLFLMQIQGSWNLCYEVEAIDEPSNSVVSAIISLGKYRPPNSDDVRKVIAKSPSLFTIVEEGEEITADAIDDGGSLLCK